MVLTDTQKAEKCEELIREAMSIYSDPNDLRTFAISVVMSILGSELACPICFMDELDQIIEQIFVIDRDNHTSELIQDYKDTYFHELPNVH